MNEKKKGEAKPRVLFVDDELEMMQSTIEQLQDSGFEIHSAADSSSACDQLHRQQYDALIDCFMPAGQFESERSLVWRNAGSKLVEMIRERDPRVGVHSHAPILILTAITDREVLADLSSLEVEAFNQKPAHPRQIAEALNRVLSAK